PEELQQLTTLVRSAIGYDQKRGDAVDVVNLRFAAAPEEAAPEAAATYLLGLSKDDLFRIGGSAALVVVALLVILLVVRPLIRRVFETLPAEADTGLRPQALLTHQGPSAGALPAPDDGNPRLSPGAEDPDQMIDLGQVEGRVRASSVRKV